LRCGDRVIEQATADAAVEALAGHAPVATSHGDLLLRNAMQRPDGELVLVDWECAGSHVADWDLALLWTQLDDTGRAIVDARIGGGARHSAFLALVLFALCREVVFLKAFRVPAEHAGMRRVTEELAAVASRLS
jgi:aminoglycoside phosphotransferase (APT) family kinase protein